MVVVELRGHGKQVIPSKILTRKFQSEAAAISGKLEEIGMDYNKFEQKKRKALRWVELAFYAVVVVVVALKVVPILWRVLMGG